MLGRPFTPMSPLPGLPTENCTYRHTGHINIISRRCLSAPVIVHIISPACVSPGLSQRRAQALFFLSTSTDEITRLGIKRDKTLHPRARRICTSNSPRQRRLGRSALPRHAMDWRPPSSTSTDGNFLFRKPIVTKTCQWDPTKPAHLHVGSSTTSSVTSLWRYRTLHPYMR